MDGPQTKSYYNQVNAFCRSFVSCPMDLGTIHGKLEEGAYSDIDDFASDITLMFRNCRSYNPPGDDVVAMAEKLRVSSEKADGYQVNQIF